MQHSIENEMNPKESLTGNIIVTFTNDSEVKYSGYGIVYGLAYVATLVKNSVIYINKSWTRKKIKTLSGDLFVNAGDSLRYIDDEIYFYNQDGGHRLRMPEIGKDSNILNITNTITGYAYELDTCSEDASAIDDVDNDMANNMKVSDLSSDLNGDPGTITAGVIETNKDNINPNHYKFGDMEAMPFIDAVTEFGEFQPVETPHVKDAIKYLIRYPRKNGLEDLKKAQWFINHLIEVREKIENSKKTGL